MWLVVFVITSLNLFSNMYHCFDLNGYAIYISVFKNSLNMFHTKIVTMKLNEGLSVHPYTETVGFLVMKSFIQILYYILYFNVVYIF